MMTTSIRDNQLDLFGYRSGYNQALKHFRMAQEFADGIANGWNLADLVDEALTEGRIEGTQIRPIVNLLLKEKYAYVYQAHNLKKKIEGAGKIVDIVKKWAGVQIVLAYMDGNGELLLVNPAEIAQWEKILPLVKDELLVCYAGGVGAVPSDQLGTVPEDFLALLYGAKITTKAVYTVSAKRKKSFQVMAVKKTVLSKASDVPVDSPSDPDPVREEINSKKVSARIAINVTNELFHNGNVEAWKRIIDSYKHKHPNLDVFIWYEDERITDINVLFKWGKVKHGTPIMISIAGENPVEVSKLRKYLFEGASSRFEAFLHGPPGSILHLF